MEKLKWAWRFHEEGHERVPKQSELEAQARTLLSMAYKQPKHTIATGGFEAWYSGVADDAYFELKFVLCDAMSF